jgi:predicted transcriptional regulator
MASLLKKASTILVSTEDEVLAGHRRLDADPHTTNIKVIGTKGWTAAEKEAYVLRDNAPGIGGRNLNAAGQKAVREANRQVALKLRNEGKSQPEISRWLGLAQQTISDLLQGAETGKEDRKKRKEPAKSDEMKHRLREGRTQKEIARELGLSQPQISRIKHKLVKGNDNKLNPEEQQSHSAAEAEEARAETKEKPQPEPEGTQAARDLNGAAIEQGHAQYQPGRRSRYHPDSITRRQGIPTERRLRPQRAIQESAPRST